MARQGTPFVVKIHFIGEKSNEEIDNIFADFYIGQVKKVLDNHNLDGEKKLRVIDRLLTYFQTTRET